MNRLRLALFGLAGACLSLGALAADSAPQPVNPVGQLSDYEMILQTDQPLRGTLRQVYVDKVSWRAAQSTKQLPYGTKIVARDFDAVPDGKGGWELANNRFVPGKPTTVLIQQKEKGWGTTHPQDIRTGEWEFAIFTAAGEQIPVNPEKDCMPCHKEVAATDYNFQVIRFLTQ
jgi:hypothetical protein